jgi:Spy/CpxP family protein refolding chaperone
MKVRMFVGLSAVALVVATLAFSAKTLRATAQDKISPPPVDHGSCIDPGFSPKTPVYPIIPVQPQPQQPPLPQSSLPEMIANLKVLRQQEQQLTAAIKEKIKAEKKSLDDVENELKSLGIDPPSGVCPPGVPSSPMCPIPIGCTTNHLTNH